MAGLAARAPGFRRVNTPERQLAVLGAPIAHSQSPALHRAAYAQLGLPWSYSAIEIGSDALPGFVGSRDLSWRGLSLTMPLKRTVLPLLDSLDDTARLVGGANTVLFDERPGGRALRGFNTDVYGIVEAFAAEGIDRLRTVHLLGSGATAASALLAAVRLGAERVVVSARTPAKAAPLERLGSDLGVRIEVRGIGTHAGDPVPHAVISTLPGGAQHSYAFDEETMARAVLLDVAYDPWPSPLASAWLACGGTVISGLEMLLHQALAQVRIFVSASPKIPLVQESAVLGAMRGSIS